MTRLIVNADDFGLTPGVNRAIAEAHRTGIVTSATLMANGAAFEDAVATAQAMPNLAVGCHIVLVDGRPVGDPHSIPTLTSRAPDGTFGFHASLTSLARRALLGKLRSDEIETEVAAQIRKLQAAGISVSHVDTHKHTHLFPAILQPVLRAAKACGVRAIRNPIEPASNLPVALRPALWKRRLQLRVLSSLAANFRAQVQAAGLSTTDGTLGITVTGSLTADLLNSMLDRVPEGSWELVCHPGYDDAELRSAGTRLLQSRAEELRIFTSERIRQTIAHRGIQLVSYREVATDKQR